MLAVMKRSLTSYWVIAHDELDSWASDATEIEHYTPEAAAKEFAADYCGVRDDGERLEVVVADNEEGRNAQVYTVTCEVTYEYDVSDPEPITVPGTEDIEENAGLVDTLTLPLFKDEGQETENG